MELQRVIDEFLVYNEVEKCISPLSLRAYAGDLRMFVRHWKRLNLPDNLMASTTRCVRQCLTSMHQERKYKASSINRRIDTLRSFYRFSVEQGYLDRDPMEKIRAPKPDATLPVHLGQDELQRLLQIPDLKNWKFKIRDKAILYLLAYTGIRRSELVSLTWENLRFDDKSIRVMGKGRKERSIPMNEALTAALWDHLQTQLPVDPKRVLFLNRDGRPLTPNNLQDLFKKYVRTAGLDPKRVSPHKMRHTFATLLLTHGTDLRTIQELLGHNELSSTQIYTHTSSAKMKSAVDRLVDGEQRPDSSREGMSNE